MSTKEEAKARLAKAHHILYMEGLAEDTYRVTSRLRQRPGLSTSGHGRRAFKRCGERPLGVDLNGNLIDGEGRLHSELPIHLEIYRSRAEIASVVHLHPYYSVLLSSVFDGKMKMITQNGMHFWEGVPLHTSPELVNSKKQGEELAQSLGGTRAPHEKSRHCHRRKIA